MSYFQERYDGISVRLKGMVVLRRILVQIILKIFIFNLIRLHLFVTPYYLYKIICGHIFHKATKELSQF